ncbi:MAG: Clp protease ClpP [Lachnospiraceae bacterium]
MKNIEVKGTVVSNDDKWIYDLLDFESVSPREISAALEEAAGDEVTLVVNSGGGDVFAGNEINYLISQYGGHTQADIVGIAASIATVICCGADLVRMTAGAQYMIHNVSGSARGDYNEMDKASGILKNANRTISNAYRLKTGMSEKELLDLMNRETWMDAQKALEYGFVDEVIGDNGTFGQQKTALYNSACFANIISEDTKRRLRDQLREHGGSADGGDITVMRNKIKIERMRGMML